MVRNRFSARVPVAVSFQGDPGRAKQSMRDECDINRIMAKYQKSGVIAHVAKYAGRYGEATAMDFRECLDVVRRAEDMFADLPAKARRRFGNDPAEFLTFVSDPANIEEMRKLGLANEARPEPQPIPVAAAAAQPAPSPAGAGAPA